MSVPHKKKHAKNMKNRSQDEAKGEISNLQDETKKSRATNT